MFWPTPPQRWNSAFTVTPQWEIAEDEYPLAVDLSTTKNFLNIPIEDTAFDAEKAAMAMAAEQEVERHISATLAPTKWVGYLPEFADQIRIERRPFRSVVSIECVEAVTGAILTVDPATYIVGRLSQKCGVVSRGDGCSWPQTARRWDAVRITVLAGYDNADSAIDSAAMHPLPDSIKQALLITTGALDKARGDGGGSSGRLANTVWGQRHGQGPSVIPDEAKALLSRYRHVVVGL